jgi:hypothetical protein
MAEVARLADVVHGYSDQANFRTPDLLIEAVVYPPDGAALDVPRRGDLCGQSGLPAARAGGARVSHCSVFFERHPPRYYILGDELTEVPAIANADAAFRRSVQRLHELALAGIERLRWVAKSRAGSDPPRDL